MPTVVRLGLVTWENTC